MMAANSAVITCRHIMPFNFGKWQKIYRWKSNRIVWIFKVQCNRVGGKEKSMLTVANRPQPAWWGALTGNSTKLNTTYTTFPLSVTWYSGKKETYGWKSNRDILGLRLRLVQVKKKLRQHGCSAVTTRPQRRMVRYRGWQQWWKYHSIYRLAASYGQGERKVSCGHWSLMVESVSQMEIFPNNLSLQCDI